MSLRQNPTTCTIPIALLDRAAGASTMLTKQMEQTYTSLAQDYLDIILKIRPIYEALSKDNKLAKCLHGQTQNANESFNGMIWECIPKTRFVSLRNLKFGVYGAVANF